MHGCGSHSTPVVPNANPWLSLDACRSRAPRCALARHLSIQMLEIAQTIAFVVPENARRSEYLFYRTKNRAHSRNGPPLSAIEISTSALESLVLSSETKSFPGALSGGDIEESLISNRECSRHTDLGRRKVEGKVDSSNPSVTSSV